MTYTTIASPAEMIVLNCCHAYLSPAFSSTASDVALVASGVTSGIDTASGVTSSCGSGSGAVSGGMASSAVSGGGWVSTVGDQ